MRRAFCSVALCLFASLALAQGTYTQIDYPGSEQTYCLGINESGDITGGQYSSGWHGFLLSGGNYTTVDYPGSLGTSLFGLNDRGQVVGFSNMAGGEGTGFLYDLNTQTFT